MINKHGGIMVKRRYVLNKLTIGALIIAVLVSALYAGDFAFSSHASEAVLSEIDIKQNYSLNEVLTIPDATLKIMDTSYDAESTLFFPDGSAYRNEEVVLNQEGRYKLEYAKRLNGKKYTVVREFSVFNAAFSFTGAKSSAYTGQSKLRPNVEEAKGLNVSIANGESFIYNRVIDLNGSNPNQPLLEMVSTPTFAGQKDARYFYIRLTDIYDEENSVTFVCYSESAYALYVKARADKVQENYVGTRRIGSGFYSYNGRTHDAYSHGALMRFSLSDEPRNDGRTNPKQEVFTLSADYSERRFFMSNNNSEMPLSDPQHITALADPLLYDNSLWTDGFTTGKAKLSMWASVYFQPTFNFTLKSVAGVDINQTIFDGSEEEAIIKIDYPTTIMPAIAGGTYPVFNATALSAFDSNPSLTTRVFYSYHQQSRIQLGIKDGRFQTPYEGNYTIEYKSVDKMGASVTELVEINALSADLGIRASLENDGDSVGTAGQSVKVHSLDVSNSNGSHAVNAVAKHKTNQNAIYTIENYAFLPLYSGEYTIEYLVSDFTSTRSVSYDLTINKGTKNLVILPQGIPKYFIKGASYVLPGASGYKFTDAGYTTHSASVTVNGVQLTGGKYTPDIVGDAEIVYFLSEGVDAGSVKTKVPVIDVGYGKLGSLDMLNYFYPTKGQFTTEARNPRLLFKTNTIGSVDGKASVEFINPLLSDNLLLRFNPDSANSNFSRINVYLRDSKNQNQTLKLSYSSAVNANAYFSINDEGKHSLEGPFFSTNISMMLEYSNQSFNVSPWKGRLYKVLSYENGEVFNGFTSGLIYVEIELEGVEGDAGVLLEMINNQMLGSSKYDSVKPYFGDNSINNVQKINSTVVINGIDVADVLDPAVTCSLSVFKPDGSYATSTSGILLKDVTDISADYSIELTLYGTYLVAYQASDSNDNNYNDRNPYGFPIIVEDREPPEITISNNRQTTAKVNSEVKIADYSVTDNITQAPIIAFMIQTPEGVQIFVAEGKTFTPLLTGIYKVIYYAMDEKGNTSIASYEVIVTR